MENDVVKQAWQEWETVSVLGRGSFGTVYKAVRRDGYLTSYAAVKVIRIPREDPGDTAYAEGLESRAPRESIESYTERVVEEIRIMQRFKGTQNVVNVEDYKVLKSADGASASIFIRMELLTPLTVYFSGKRVTEEEVVKLGRDVCAALKLCEQAHVIHRDVKPENIFVNDFGDFKLGDFGIARVIEPYEAGVTSAGTRQYMAPEVAAYKPYDGRADLYSLCLTLYALLNENRLPFLADKRLFTPGDREEAMRRRMSGEALPPPVNASEKLAKVLAKGCAFLPADRFAAAEELDRALAEAAGIPAPVSPARRRRWLPVVIPVAAAVVMIPLLLLTRSCGKAREPIAPESAVIRSGGESEDQKKNTKSQDTRETATDPGASNVEVPGEESGGNASAPRAPAAPSETPSATPSSPPKPAETYTVTFHANGGSGAPATVTKTEGVALTLPAAAPTRSGYVFRGWAASSGAASGAWQAGGTYEQEGNATLYAVWKKTYTITFKADGSGNARNVPDPVIKVQGETLYLPTTVPQKSGNRFLGWRLWNGTSAQFQPGDAFTLDQNTELYGEWTVDLSQS